MTERNEYDEATKAAVMAALLLGQSVADVAKQYKINPATVRSWKSRQQNGEGVASIATVATEKRQRIGEALLDYAEAMLITLKVQAEHFRDKKWLDLQRADALAVLHGVSVDKTVRLLEALAGDESSDDGEIIDLP